MWALEVAEVMPVYRVLLLGENFLMRVNYRKKLMGFYTTRYVDAANPKDAELAAVQMIRDDPKMTGVSNKDWHPKPTIYLEEISEQEYSKIPVQGGYGFFDMDEKN